MNLQFSFAANKRYKEWKSTGSPAARNLKNVILETLQNPFEGSGSPFSLDDKSGLWARSFGSGLFMIYSATSDVLRIEAISEVVHQISDVELSNEEKHREAINLMRRFEDDGKPKLGIFWYDPKSNSLFGVEKGNAELYSDQGKISTYPKLHKSFWQKMHLRAIAQNDIESIFYNEYDYTQIPRGRVFLDNGIFYVNVGDWINGYINGEKCIDKDKLRQLIVDEFNLPEDFIYRQDVHWDIGHGWSEEQL